MKKSSVCPKCGEFLGSLGNLTECPICGKSFEEEL